MAITSVARNPFARGELLRQSESSAETHETCAWCGNRPRTLYRYAWQQDGYRSVVSVGRARPFCNLRCHTAYNG